MTDVNLFFWAAGFMAVALSAIIAVLVLRCSSSPYRVRNAVLSCIGSAAVYALWILAVFGMLTAGGSSGLLLLLPVGCVGFLGCCWALKLDKL